MFPFARFSILSTGLALSACATRPSPVGDSGTPATDLGTAEGDSGVGTGDSGSGPADAGLDADASCRGSGNCTTYTDCCSQTCSAGSCIACQMANEPCGPCCPGLSCSERVPFVCRQCRADGGA